MLIEGYDDGPLGAGESLLARPGSWSNYLSEICAGRANARRPVPEWFGEDGADVDALSEILFDPERWPVLRVPGADGSGVVVVFRNLDGDYGTDFLLIHPGRSYAEQIASWEGELSGTGLTWQELVPIADNPAPEADGIDEPAARLLLLLPLLNDLEVPEEASARLSATLTSVGVAQDITLSTTEHLLTGLTGRSWHDPAWGSPLSS
ncbi:hypothetical protein [Streptomyces sp. FIT100]|uniref:hypothetical protein n=1 Tax=Streptomyces sp. FIT100 TaxID=2837956 RepID=UPI0021CA8D5F|nr:hypothetical protein [Streptomyces sp. FIT100]UUN29667.1 hypothetical protein KK483_27270 [Streptomyces sp. FIT100]